MECALLGTVAGNTVWGGNLCKKQMNEVKKWVMCISEGRA